MSYSVKAIPKFEKNLKKLAKKYASLKAEYTNLVKSLKENPQQGTLIGRNCYKIRLSIASKGKGKSGGARVITNVAVRDDTVYLLTIYDKSDKENLSDKEPVVAFQHQHFFSGPGQYGPGRQEVDPAANDNGGVVVHDEVS